MQQLESATCATGAGTQTQPSARMNEPTVTATSRRSSTREPNMLHLSSQRSRRFYERAARELFASGSDEVHLSALKSAVPLAITVSLSLQDKKAATISKINTQQVPFDASKSRTHGNSAGVTITLTRHADFRGTRIVPAHVFFTPPLTDSNMWAYPESPDGVLGLFASVISGPADSMFSSKYGEALMAVLKKVGQGDVEMQKKLQAHLFEEAVKANKEIQELTSVKFIGELATVKTYNPNLKAAFVRYCPHSDLTDMTGTAFIEVFEDDHCPHNNPNNGAVVYLIAPCESKYKSSQEFVNAVEVTAANLMAALSDFNGYCRRGSAPTTKLKRIAIARLGLFRTESSTAKSETTKTQIAEAILKGLNKAYHFGIAPKLQFSVSEDEGAAAYPNQPQIAAFFLADFLKKAWIEQTGTDTILRVTENNFGRRTSTEAE